jgi:hypothetical protein
MKPWLTLSFLLPLSLVACAPGGASMYRASNQQRVVPDGLNVTIVNARDEGDGFPFAEGYCEKRGREAQYTGHMQYHTSRKVSDSISFHCVLPARGG